MELYGEYFVNWDDNRGEAPVNHDYLVEKRHLGIAFWFLSLDQMCSAIHEIITSSKCERPGRLFIGKSCHFADIWGERDGFG